MEEQTPEQLAEGINKSIEALKVDLSKSVKKEDLEGINKELDTLKESVKGLDVAKVNSLGTEIEKLEAVIKSQGDAMLKYETTASSGTVSFKEDITKSLEAKKEDFTKWIENKSKGGYFTLYETKAAGSTTSANITSDTTPDNYAASMADGYSPYIREEIFVEEYFDRGTTDKPSLAYVNETAGEGDAAIVAEGSLKPLIDADYLVKYSEARKVAGRMKVSEEALSDFKWLQSAMTTTLKRKHDIARQTQLISGDGTGSNLTGIVSLATPYAASMLTGIAGTIESANNYDALAAMATAINVQSEGVFTPNVAFVNPIDALAMKLTKDLDNNYILPPFITADGRVVDGLTIVAKPAITLGSFIIGDFKNVNVRDVWGYRVEIGRSGDDFAENMFTMIGESRLHLYITDNDKRGLISGDFATVKAALETA